MAARVASARFGRHENTRRDRLRWPFAYCRQFRPVSVSAIATVEHVAERAKVSARIVQRHSPTHSSAANVIYAPTRAGGHVPTVWKILVSEPAGGIENRGQS